MSQVGNGCLYCASDIYGGSVNMDMGVDKTRHKDPAVAVDYLDTFVRIHVRVGYRADDSFFHNHVDAIADNLRIPVEDIGFFKYDRTHLVRSSTTNQKYG